MWCFSVKDGRIASVNDLNGLSDQEAIEKAKLFFGSSLNGVGKAVFWVGLGSDRLGSSLL
jgi:hypothetical protein